MPAHRLDPLAGHQHRAIGYRRTGYRQNKAGAEEHHRGLKSGLLSRAVGPRDDLVIAGFELVMPLAELLLEFLGHQIYRRIKVALYVLGKDVRAGERDAQRTGELPFG